MNNLNNLNNVNNVNYDTYKKNAVDFSNEKMNMTDNLTFQNRCVYVNDIEHGKAQYSDENLLFSSGIEDELELECNNEQLKELRKRVIEKMSKRYYARV